MITPEGICAEHDEINCCDSCAENERERIINILMTRLEQFDCDICGDCITPKRLAEMIREQAIV